MKQSNSVERCNLLLSLCYSLSSLRHTITALCFHFFSLAPVRSALCKHASLCHYPSSQTEFLGLVLSCSGHVRDPVALSLLPFAMDLNSSTHNASVKCDRMRTQKLRRRPDTCHAFHYEVQCTCVFSQCRSLLDSQST